jgi:hypothetical protein
MPLSQEAQNKLNRQLDEEWFALARQQSPAVETMARAIEADDAAGVRAALAAGVEVNSWAPRDRRDHVSGPRGEKTTWLVHAMDRAQPRLNAMAALLEAGADPMQCTDTTDKVPAVLAAFRDARAAAIGVFRAHGVTIDAFTPADQDGWGPLAYLLGCGIPNVPLDHPHAAHRKVLADELLAAGGTATPHQKAQVLYAAVSSTLPTFLEALRPLGIQLEDTNQAERTAMLDQAQLVKQVWENATVWDSTERRYVPARSDQGQGWLDTLAALPPPTETVTPSRRRRAP